MPGCGNCTGPTGHAARRLSTAGSNFYSVVCGGPCVAADCPGPQTVGKHCPRSHPPRDNGAVSSRQYLRHVAGHLVESNCCKIHVGRDSANSVVDESDFCHPYGLAGVSTDDIKSRVVWFCYCRRRNLPDLPVTRTSQAYFPQFTNRGRRFRDVLPNRVARIWLSDSKKPSYIRWKTVTLPKCTAWQHDDVCERRVVRNDHLPDQTFFV